MATPAPSCSLLGLPPELRLAIGEAVFRQHPAVLHVDLRRPPPPDTGRRNTYAFILTCRKIYRECASLRYEVNTVSLLAPALTAALPSVADRKCMEEIASRLGKLASHQATVRQLRRTTVFLGQLPNLQSLRWLDFLASWLLVKDSISSLMQQTPDLVFTFGIYLNGGVTARVEVCAQSSETLLAGLESCHLRDGSRAELTEDEAVKLKKIRATIARTLCPKTPSTQPISLALH